MSTTQHCFECRYFSPTGEHSDVVEATTKGQCRKLPPRPLGATPHNTPNAERTGWPIVFAGEWCGEFQPRMRCHNGSAKRQPCGSVSKCTERCSKRHESRSVCNGKMAEENFTEKSCVCKVGRKDTNFVQKDTKAGCFAMVPSCQNGR